MRLYSYFRSSASYRVRIALALKGLSFEYVPVHLVKNEQLAPAFRAVAPAQLVPALVVDGADGRMATLTQSLAIIEYLEETVPEPPLLPKDALGRARVRTLALDIACEIHPLDNLRVLRYLQRELKVSDADKDRWYRHWVETGLEVVERELAGHPSTGRFLPRRHAGPGRLRAGAADLQCQARRHPVRALSDRDARLRCLHGRSGIRVDATFGLPRRRVSAPHDWLAPDGFGTRVGALMTTRAGGCSEGRYASMNVGSAVGDVLDAVRANRARLASTIGAAPVFLRQVHGVRVVRVGAADAADGAAVHDADACVCTEVGIACVVQAADCLPVLLAAPDGRAVAAAHAGWRGLAGGVVEAAVGAVCDAAGCAPGALRAWLGACIGPRAFEVGADVLQAFGVNAAAQDRSAVGFVPCADGKWLADLPGLARDRLAAVGVERIDGGSWCTVEEPSRFFSFRRDGVTGRMAAAIWIEP